MSKRVQLIRADTFEYLPDAPADSIDCVVTSPPYWGLKGYNGAGNLYGNEATLEEYRANTRVLCRQLYRIGTPTGSALVNVGYKRDAGRLIDLPALWAEDAESEGFFLQQKIVWHKKGHVTPGSAPTRERDTHEIVLHLTKEKSGYFYEAAREPYKTARQASAKSQHHKVYKWRAQGC